MKNHPMNWQVLSKYMKGECSGEELRRLQDWLKASPANEDFFQSYVENSTYEPDMDAGEVQDAWKNLKKRHLNNNKDIVSGHYGNGSMPEKSWWAGYGQKWVVVSSAAALVLLLTAFGMYQLKKKGYFAPEKTVKKITYRTFTTKKGQNTKLRLKDGTMITLNAASKLRIPENYGSSGKRIVYLQGEAFFEVTHNEAMPFTVHSGDLIIQDVGTSFDILAYDSTEVSVAVKEGAVSVGKTPKVKTQSVQILGQLTKNKVGRIRSDGEFSISTIKDISLFTGWMEGKFTFRNTPLSKVVEQLERRFNVSGEIKGSALKKRTLTATYEDLSLKQILKVMSVSLHIAYTYHDSTVIFKPKK